MKTFDEILFDVNIELLPEREERFRPWLDTPEDEVEEDMVGMYQAVVANNKITEADFIPVIKKGTRKPTNREERRDLTDKVKADAIKKAYHSHKGGYTVIYRGENGETKVTVPISEWLTEGKKAFWENVKAAKKTGNRQRFDWKKADSKKHRHEGKGVCRDYTEDDCLDVNPWEYTDEEKCQFENLHGDFSDEDITKIINDYHNYDCDDFEDYYGYDPYQSALDDREAAWEEIGELKKEIATYKDFLGEFNLNTLYQRWLEDNKKGVE